MGLPQLRLIEDINGLVSPVERMAQQSQNSSSRAQMAPEYRASAIVSPTNVVPTNVVPAASFQADPMSEERPDAPKVFVSYSRDTPKHIAWVTALAERLARNGIHVVFDEWDLRPGHDLTAFMNQAVINSDKVILICTSHYVSKANLGKGGAGYEGMITNAELLQNTRTPKFIPVLRDNADGAMPTALATRLYIDLRTDSDEVFDHLIQALHDRPSAAGGRNQTCAEHARRVGTRAGG